MTMFVVNYCALGAKLRHSSYNVYRWCPSYFSCHFAFLIRKLWIRL